MESLATDSRLDTVYRKGEALTWKAEDIDWNLSYDQKIPRYLTMFWRKFEPFQALSNADKEEVLFRHYKWILSQAVEGERIAIQSMNRLLELSECPVEIKVATQFLNDELRHYEVTRRYVEKLGPVDPLHPKVKEVIEGLYETKTGCLLGIHIVEKASPFYYDLHVKFGSPLLKEIFKRINEDERRHMAYGHILLEHHLESAHDENASALAQRVLDGFSWWAYPPEGFIDLPGLAEFSKPFYYSNPARAIMARTLTKMGLTVTTE